MVHKNNKGRVWQNKQKIIQQHQINTTNEQNRGLNQEQQRNSSESSDHEQKIPVKHYSDVVFRVSQQFQQPAQQKKVENQNKMEKNTQLIITSQLLTLLNDKIYKEIVLSELIEISLSPQSLENQKSSQPRKFQLQNSSYDVRPQQIQQITDFILAQSLPIPSYLQPFKRNSSGFTPPFKKHKALSFFNTTLLELSCIKFLNIYGPTGSGKTFTLNSIISKKKSIHDVIWINGMNIINGKTKKFISDLREIFDKTFWQFYNRESTKDLFASEELIVDCTSKRNEKILILDQYDQINDFELEDLLKYAYIKGFERQHTEKKKMFRISKVIFVSNNFEPTQQFMQKYGNMAASRLTQGKILYMEHLIFKPFSEKEAESILLKKIHAVNRKCVDRFSSIAQVRDMFTSDMKGVFQDENLTFIIKKVSVSQEIDIRKILQFYANSFKKWIESLGECIQNQKQMAIQLRIHSKRTQKAMKAESYLVDKKFIQNSLLLNSNSIKVNSQCQDDSNPLMFYLTQIENQGKNILRAIYETLKFKKKFLSIETFEDSKRKQKNEIKFEKEAKSMFASEKIRQNTVRIMDFFGKIRPKLQLYDIYPWVIQWQQIGLIKIRKENSHKTFEVEVGINRTNKIKITDNFLIQVLDMKTIQQALDLFY